MDVELAKTDLDGERKLLPIWKSLLSRFRIAHAVAKPHLAFLPPNGHDVASVSATVMECLTAIQDVHTANYPYGALPGDPQTFLMCNSIFRRLTRREPLGVPSSPLLEKIQTQLRVPHALRDRIYQLQQEFRDACYAAKCRSSSDYTLSPFVRFHTHLPLPETLAQWCPVLTCFWRNLQRFQNLARVREQWALQRDLYVWSDVNTAHVMQFFQDLQILGLHTLGATSCPLPISLSFADALRQTFACNGLLGALPWSFLPNGGVTHTEAAKSFGLERPVLWPYQPDTETGVKAVVPTLVSFQAPTAMRHVCSEQFSWRSDTPSFGLSTHLISNVLSAPGNGTYVVLLPVPSSAVPLMQNLRKEGRASRVPLSISLQRLLPSYGTSFAHTPSALSCDCWLVYPPSGPPPLCHAMLFHAFASVVSKYGGRMDALPPQLLTYRVQSKECREYFSWAYGQETAVRAGKLRSTWCTKRRVVRTSFSWEGVAQSYNVINRLLHMCESTTERKISSWT